MDGWNFCSGSLLAGGGYVLTAGHCLAGNGAGTTGSIFVSFAGGSISRTATQYYVDPGWNGDLSKGDDLAIIKLDTPITEVSGYQLYTQPVSSDTPVLIAGYGYTGEGATGYVQGALGTLHYGYNEYDAPQDFYTFAGMSSSVFLYDFDDGTDANNLFGSTGVPDGEEAMIAPGNSGGGSFVYVNGTWELVATHDFIGCVSDAPSCTPNSSFGQFGGDVSVAANIAWIESIDPAAAPEPGVFALLGVGFAGLALVRKEGRRFVRAPFGTPAARA